MLQEAADLTPQEPGEDTASWVPYLLLGVAGLCLLCGMIASLFVWRRNTLKRKMWNEEGSSDDTKGMDTVAPVGDASASRGLVGPGGYGKVPTCVPKLAAVEGDLTSI